MTMFLSPNGGSSGEARGGDPSRPGPYDYNRRGHPGGGKGPGFGLAASPAPLAWAYWILIAAAIILLTSGLVGLFGTGAAQPTDIPAEQAEYLRSNRRFLAIANTIAAIVLGCVVPQMANGSRWGRRIAAAVMGIAAFLNIAAIALQVGGMFLLIIPVLLAIAAWLMFRPSANQFLRERTWEECRIVD